MELYDNIKKLRKLRRMSQEELAKKTGYTDRSSIAKIESGEVDLAQSKIQLFASALGVTPNELMGNMDNSIDDELAYKSAHVAYIKVPLYSSLCCGDGGFVDDNILDYVAVPSANLSDSLEYFAQYAEGNSMIDAGIESGDLLVFQKTPSINSGDIGCFCIDENEATCKKLKKQGDTIILQPMNTEYDPIIVDVLNNHFAILGKLKKIIKDVQ